jgi:tape measure domain-containing protein
MTTNLEQLLVRIDATTEGLRRELKLAENSVGRTQGVIDRATAKIDKSFSGIATTIRRDVIGGLSLVAGAMSVRKVIEYADTWKQLEGRLRVVTKTNEEFVSVQRKLFALADSNRASISSTVNLYSRLAMAVGNNEKAMRNILPTVEAISKGIAITGESSAAAEGAIVQFAQGLATNFSAAGQEIRSLQEQAPRVAKALADGLNEIGVTSNATAGSLNALAKNGVITAENSMRALATQVGVLRSEIEKTPKTVGQAFTALDNAFLKTLGASKVLEAGTSSLTYGINALAQNLEKLAAVLGVVASLIAARYAQSLALAVAGQIAMAAGIIRVQLALAAMGGASTVAAGGLLALTGAMKLLKGAMGVFSVVAIYEMIDGNESLIATQEKLNAEVQNTGDKLNMVYGIHGKLTDEAVEEVKKRIGAYKKEVEALELILKAQLDNRSNAGLMMRGVKDFAGETVVEGIFGRDYQSLEEVIKKQESYNKAIGELDGLLVDVGSRKPGAPVDALNGAQDKLIEKQKEYRGDLAVTIAQQQALADASNESADAYERLKIAIEAENEAREQGFAAGTREYEAVKSAIMQRERLKSAIDANLKRYEQERQAQEDYQKELMKPWEHAMENVQDSLAEMFEQGKFSFESLANIAKKLAAEVAAAWVIRPILGSLTGLGGGGVGVPGSAGPAGAMSSISGLGSLYSAASSATGIFGNSSFLTGGLDKVGSLLGIGNSSFVGPMPNGGMAGGLSQMSSFTNGSFGGTLGAGVGSLGGNFLANAILGGDRGIGSNIGGTIGAFAGSFIPVPILGPMIGAFVGNAIGGLFGNNKPSSKLQGGNISLSGGDATGYYGLTGKKFSQENKDSATGLLQLGQGIAKALAAVTGETFKENLRIEVGGRDGIGIAIGDAAQKNFGTAGEALKALTLGIADLADQSNQAVKDIQTAAEKIDFSKPEKALEDIAFAAGFSSLGEMPRILSDVDQAVTAMNQQFAEATATAERLGLATEKLKKFQQQQAEALLKGYGSAMSRSLLGMLAPQQLQVMDEQARYTAQLKDLHTLNASAKEYQIAQVLHQAALQQIMEQNNGLQQSALETEQRRLETATDLSRRFAAISGTFKSLLFDIQYGRYANDTPVQNLQNMRSLVQSLGTAAAGGDADAAEQLSQLLPAFLDLSGEVNGFNAQFRMDRQMAEGLAKSTLSAADRQVMLQTQLAGLAQRQIEVMQSGFGALQAALSKFGGGLTVDDVLNSAAGVSANTLRAGETAASISGYNPVNNLSESTVRAAKASVGFDFSAPENANRTFAQWVQSGNAAAGAAFNAKVAAQGGTTQQFAVGGMVSGTSGIDQIDARLTDGEFVMRRNAVRSIGRASMEHMNRTGNMPGSDNSAVVAGLDKLSTAVGQLIRITAATGNVTVNQLQGVKNEMADLANNARLVAAL